MARTAQEETRFKELETKGQNGSVLTPAEKAELERLRNA